MVDVITVNKPIPHEALGKTLMHEHLQIGFPGWETDALLPRPVFREMVAACVDKIQQLQGAGFATLVDPCPSDMGRDVALMAEVSARTGFNIICATGLYVEAIGSTAYWRLRAASNRDTAKYLADVYIKELTQGIGGTGVKAGVIKLSTGHPPLGDYEKMLMEAAGLASLATGAPIVTHTEAVLGDVQQSVLTGMGVSAHKIVIGHSCGTDDFDYHMKLVRGGSYLGFDRFGVTLQWSDEKRVASLARLAQADACDQIVISHDSIWCFQGNFLNPVAAAALAATHEPMRFTNVITPLLLEAGVTPRQIEQMLIDNPRRYFSDQPLSFG
jgi:phosphotriesterase-related protein